MTFRLAAPEGFRVQARSVLEALMDHDIDAALAPTGEPAHFEIRPADEVEPSELDAVVLLPLQEPRDALVGRDGRVATLAGLPLGRAVGLSGGLRRQMLGVHRPDLRAVDVDDIREVAAMLEREQIDAWIATTREIRAAGMSEQVGEVFEPTSWATGAGRGAVAVRLEVCPERVRAALSGLDDAGARAGLTAELAVLEELAVPRTAPVGVMARPHGELLRVRAMVPCARGRRLVRAEVSGVQSDPVGAGRRTAALLLERGAAELLASGGAS